MTLLLEIARGLAALWVFAFHAQDLFKDSAPILFQIAQYGNFGVPMFFVISGYVITHSAESCLGAGNSAWVFLTKRFLRIYPAFWASILVVLATPYVVEAISMLKSGSFHMPEWPISKYTATEWLNFFLLTKVFFAENGDLQSQFNAINAVYWTIAIEMQFYVAVFASLCLGRHYRLSIAAISLLAFINLAYPLALNPGFFIHHWPMFALGIVLAYVHKSGLAFDKLFTSRPLVWATGATAFFAALLPACFRQGSASQLVFAMSFAAMLWCAAPWEAVLAGIKKGGKRWLFWLLEPFLILGAMSYSVYLLHGKIYQLPYMFVRQVVSETSLLYGLATMLGTLMLCFPFYLAVERRFMSQNYSRMHRQVLELA